MSLNLTPYLRIRPRSGEGVAFATKFGWAVLDKFPHNNIIVLTEVPKLDQLLLAGGLNPFGDESSDHLSDWRSMREKMAFDSNFSTVVLGAILESCKEDEAPDVDTDVENQEDIQTDSDETPESDECSDTPDGAASEQPDFIADLNPAPDVVEEATTTEPLYTYEQLVAMDMKDLRAIGDKYGVKNISKDGLAKEILEAIAKV